MAGPHDLTDPPPRKRGRPREPETDRRILAGARGVVGDLGVHGASVSAIAERAGVGKPTIYLRHRDQRAVIVAEILDLDLSLAPARGKGIREALTRALVEDRELLVLGPDARFLRSVLFESAFDEEIARALNETVLGPRRARIIGIITQGVDEGRVRSDLDAGDLADLLIAPLIRTMVLAAKGTPKDVERHVAVVAEGFFLTRPR